MRALVTGASGFVGHHLIQHLLSCGDNVVAAVAPGTKTSLGIETIEGDVVDYRQMVNLVSSASPDVIYHLAGIAFAPAAENDFSTALNVNVGGTFNVLRAAHLQDREIRVVAISSGEVYGRVAPKDIPVKENLEPKPANSYSLSKLMSELIPLRYETGSKIKIVTMRPFNHTGPGQNENFVCSNFAKQLAQIKLGMIPAVLKVGNLTPERDFSDVRDIVRAYRLAAEKGQGLYNLGSGAPTPISRILHLLIEIAKVDVSIEIDQSRVRPAEVPVLYADISKAKNELGWSPLLGLQETLTDVYNYWYRELTK